MDIIDAHAHLWLRQNGKVNGMDVFPVGGGKSNFGGSIRQMMPPYMTDDANTAERFLANMDYARVSAAIITQEEIDGNQDDYLRKVRQTWPDRFRVCSLYEENKALRTEGFDGIKLCAGRLPTEDLTKHAQVFERAWREGKFISVDLADGDRQTGSLKEMICQYPELKIAIGHFGMVTRPGWLEQIHLARYQNVYIESGGITWLFNAQFYPYPDAIRAIREAADICGFDKLMWGSDYPRTMVEITYKMSYDFVVKSDQLTDDEKACFLGGNAQKFYGFDSLVSCCDIPNML